MQSVVNYSFNITSFKFLKTFSSSTVYTNVVVIKLLLASACSPFLIFIYGEQFIYLYLYSLILCFDKEYINFFNKKESITLISSFSSSFFLLICFYFFKDAQNTIVIYLISHLLNILIQHAVSKLKFRLILISFDLQKKMISYGKNMFFSIWSIYFLQRLPFLTALYVTSSSVFYYVSILDKVLEIFRALISASHRFVLRQQNLENWDYGIFKKLYFIYSTLIILSVIIFIFGPYSSAYIWAVLFILTLSLITSLQNIFGLNKLHFYGMDKFILTSNLISIFLFVSIIYVFHISIGLNVVNILAIYTFSEFFNFLSRLIFWIHYGKKYRFC